MNRVLWWLSDHSQGVTLLIATAMATWTYTATPDRSDIQIVAPIIIFFATIKSCIWLDHEFTSNSRRER